MVKRKGRLIIILVFAIMFLLLGVNFVKDTTIRIPTLSDLRVEEVYIYDGDENGERLEVKKVVKIEGGKTTEEKLQTIVNELQKKFEDIELCIKGYENVNGKRILIIDLKDRYKSVDSYLNSGSAGSRMYLGIIVNTLLQNEKSVSNWIDGVKILVNGEENVEGEHISLEGIFYKSKNKTIQLQ